MIYMMIYTMIYIKVYWQRGFLPPLNEDDACMFTESERLIQEHIKKYKSGAAELKDLIQQVLHHPAFDPQDVDHDMHERLMRCMEDDDIQIIDLWEEGDGNQEVLLYKRSVLKVLLELLSDEPRSGWLVASTLGSRSIRMLQGSVF